MDDERFFSGYCKAMDRSRMVTVEISEGTADADCAYPDCPYAPGCPIAEAIRQAAV